MVETSGMVLRTFYRVPKHISRSNQKFQNQLPATDPTIVNGKHSWRELLVSAKFKTAIAPPPDKIESRDSKFVL